MIDFKQEASDFFLTKMIPENWEDLHQDGSINDFLAEHICEAYETWDAEFLWDHILYLSHELERFYKMGQKNGANND